jgi:RNA polymerase sigma-70 factor (ECF subfamily)
MAVPPKPASADLREELSRSLVDHGDRLYALALRVTRDPDLAADALQEAFATALERAGDFRGESSLGTWLHRIVYTKAIDLLRRRGKEAALPDEESLVLGDEDDRLSRSPAWARPPDEILLGAETLAALERAVLELTPMQRTVFEMREVEGRTTDEVAEILGIPAGTVRVHLHRARLRLRARLSGHFHKAPA